MLHEVGKQQNKGTWFLKAAGVGRRKAKARGQLVTCVKRKNKEEPLLRTEESEPAQAEWEAAGGEKFTACLIAGGATVPLCTQNPVNSTEVPAC